jgi:hypothetical protein
MDARRLLLGDWSRWVRDPIDLLRATFLIGAVWFAATGDPKGVANLIVASIAVLVARAIDLPRAYDLCFVIAMIFTGWGEALGLYDAIGWYDNLVHFIVPMLTAPVAYIGLARLDLVPDPRDETTTRHYVGMAIVTFALGVAIGGLWEIVEWTSDGVLGSELSLSNDDTVGDLIADSSGSLCGAVLLVCWAKFGWGSVRRIPGENRFEAVDA